jgi:hypothetical protein
MALSQISVLIWFKKVLKIGLSLYRFSVHFNPPHPPPTPLGLGGSARTTHFLMSISTVRATLAHAQRAICNL